MNSCICGTKGVEHQGPCVSYAAYTDGKCRRCYHSKACHKQRGKQPRKAYQEAWKKP